MSQTCVNTGTQVQSIALVYSGESGVGSGGGGGGGVVVFSIDDMYEHSTQATDIAIGP